MATGWGKKTWGAEAWGDLSDTSVTLGGLSLTSSIGTETHVIDHQVTLSGIQLTSSIGTAVGGTSALVSVTGSLESIGVGTVSTPIGQDVGVSLEGGSASKIPATAFVFGSF